jgi:type IV pilus assembly protein PilY1
VALNRNTSGNFLSVSIGSGNRTNPLLTGAKNNLYMLRDEDLDKGAPAAGFTTIKAKNLFDATSDSISSTDAKTAKKAQQSLDDARGWMVALSADEKVLSALVTFEGKLLATTFQADTSADPDLCGFETTGRFYLMDVANAAPADTLGDSSTNYAEDGQQLTRSRTLQSSGIPSSPVIVFPKGSGVVQVIVDKETVNLINQKLSRVYWHAR